MTHELRIDSESIQELEYEIASLLEVGVELQAFETTTLEVSMQSLSAMQEDARVLPSFVPQAYSTTPVMGL